MNRYPEGISLDIGVSCNNNCIFCVNSRGCENIKDLPLAKIKNKMKEIRYFLDGIIINGGEPAIRKDIVEIIEYARQINFKEIMMISNARMFCYDSLCKSLVNAGLGLVFVTIQAQDKYLHDKQTLVKGSFLETVQGIKNLKKYGIEVYTNTVINKMNYKDIPALPMLLSSLKVDFSKLSFIRFKGNAKANKENLFIRMTDVIPYIKKAADNFIKLKKGFVIQEIPFCVIRSHIKHIRKGQKFPVIIKTQPDGDKFLRKYYRGGNIKRAACKECVYYGACLGPWQEYVKYFGWSEFKPLDNEQFN